MVSHREWSFSALSFAASLKLLFHCKCASLPILFVIAKRVKNFSLFHLVALQLRKAPYFRDYFFQNSLLKRSMGLLWICIDLSIFLICYAPNK